MVENNGFTALPNWVFTLDPPLTSKPLSLYCALLYEADYGKSAWVKARPGTRRLQALCRMKRESVISGLKTLENYGLIKVVSEGRGRATSSYLVRTRFCGSPVEPQDTDKASDTGSKEPLSGSGGEPQEGRQIKPVAVPEQDISGSLFPRSGSQNGRSGSGGEPNQDQDQDDAKTFQDEDCAAFARSVFDRLWTAFLELRPIRVAGRREGARAFAETQWWELLGEGVDPQAVSKAACGYLAEAAQYDRERVMYLGTFLSGPWRDWLDNDPDPLNLERPCFG